MMHKKNKFLLLLFTLFFFLTPLLAYADGMIIRYPIEDIGYDYAKENSQRAYINHQDGVEKLIVSVDIEKSEDKKLWIFPVPANYSGIKTDIGTKEPDLRGAKITDGAAYFIKDVQDVFLISQIYPLFISNFLFGSLRNYRSSYEDSISPNMTGSLKSSESSESYDVIVRSEVVKEGMTVQVITARTAQGVKEHFNEKGLDFDPESLNVLNNYIGQDEYSFIATWINETSPVNETKVESRYQSNYFNRYNPYNYSDNSKTRSVYVEFPTKETYFPMILTSVYDHEIPVDIRILGLNKIKRGSIYHKLASAEYYTDKYVSTHGDKVLLKFLSGYKSTDAIDYTLIKIRGSAASYTEDFYSVKGAPLKVSLASLINNPNLNILFIILSLMFFVGLSVISSLLAGHVAFPHHRNKKGRLKLGLLSISNALTIFGLLISTLIIRPDKLKADENVSEDVADSVQKIKDEGYDVEIRIRGKKKGVFLYLLLFSIIFCLLTLIVFLPIILWFKSDMSIGEILLVGAFF